ncbi:MAG: hypothetical protein EOM59_01450 [Clostridia bacterium]|nr:hypothetical protein [Clostridia bacterium]
MTLHQQWTELIEGQNDDTFDDFWEKYSSTEEKIYRDILSHHKTIPQGSFQEMVEKYNADPVIFMGFLDGINSSLKEPLLLDAFDENSEIKLNITFDKLLYNMFIANADYLYNLEEWEDILTQEEREEIYTSYRRSRTVTKEKKIGRNEPCPCGSGKKYKQCCGKNQ